MAKQYTITALDMGSGSIKILSVSKKKGDSHIDILGKGEEFSLGIRRGVVINSSRVSQIISLLKDKLSQSSGKKINSVYASIDGGHLSSAFSRGLVSVSRADQKISEEDIERVLKAAQTFPIPSNSEILEVYPKEFFVDGEGGVKEAIGMQGVRLEADVLVLCGFSPYVKNSSKTILDTGLQINYLIPAALASSKAVLTQREKELGVCVLDIGAGTTGMTVFEEGNLIHLAVFPIGSGHITNDIAVCLKTDIETAEKIKVEFGGCKEVKKSEKSEKKIKIEGEEPLFFSKKMLNDIIEARVGEIFDMTNKELKKISKQGKLPAGVILTGGGAKIPGIKEFAKSELKLPVKIGMPIGFSSFGSDPRLATLCGLILEGIEAEEGQETTTEIRNTISSKFKKIFGMFIP